MTRLPKIASTLVIEAETSIAKTITNNLVQFAGILPVTLPFKDVVDCVIGH